MLQAWMKAAISWSLEPEAREGDKVVQVKLSENSVMGRLEIVGTDGRSEITRDDACSVPSNWALIRISDPNLMFTFEEEDRAILSSLEGKMLELVGKQLGLETAEAIEAELLPKAKKSKLSSITSKKTETAPKEEASESDDS